MEVIPYGIYDVANNEGWVNVGDNGLSAFQGRVMVSSRSQLGRPA